MEEMYAKLLSYRLYRLHNRNKSRNNRDRGRVKDYIKQMNLPLADHHYTGKDPIRILEFLARFVQEEKYKGLVRPKPSSPSPHSSPGWPVRSTKQE